MHRRATLLRMLLTAATITAATAVVRGAPAPSLKTVLARAAAYVGAYERDLGSVIAQERYMQEVSVPGAGGPGARYRQGDRTPKRRMLFSEFFFVKPAPDRDVWLGFRHVLSVDDFPVPDSTVRLHDLLAGQRELTDAEFRQLINESARYNIGRVGRNVNVPTFPLLILHAAVQQGFTFRRRGSERLEGVDTWAIAFEEHAHPTLIRDAEGRDVRATGTFWLDPSSGRVVQTELVTDQPADHLHARITVKYRVDEALDLWVPVEMTERYHAGLAYRDERNVLCVARYSKFRRFEVKVRLVPPPVR